MQEQTKSKINYKILVLLLLLWTILAVGLLLGYNYWSQYVQERSTMHSKISDLGSKVDSTHQKINQYIDHQPTDTQLTDSALLPVKTALVLTQLANEKLKSSRDVRLAQHLLRAAQENLATTNDAQLVNIKAMLVQDQEKLSAVKAVDIEEIDLKLDEIEPMLDTMPLNGVNAKKQKQQNMAADQNSSKWQQALTSVMDDAKSVVKVRQKSEIDAAMLKVGKEVQTAHAKILLSQIRWAVYYNDAAVYQRSIRKLSELITQIYDNSNPDVAKFQQILADLSTQEVQPDVPDLSNTVQALQAILVR